jgi:hypothetical protein
MTTTVLETYLPAELFKPEPLSLTDFGRRYGRRYDPQFEEIQSAIRRKAYFGVGLGEERNALNEIAWLLDNRPSAQTDFEVEELDRIADGAATEEDRGDVICEVQWFEGFLDSVDWWSTAVGSLLRKHHKFGSSPDPASAEQGEEIFRLLGDVLMAYVPAKREWIYADELDREASMELLKRYRLFTRYVCAFAQKLFPGTPHTPINLAPLLERA